MKSWNSITHFGSQAQSGNCGGCGGDSNSDQSEYQSAPHCCGCRFDWLITCHLPLGGIAVEDTVGGGLCVI